ncbi:MAG: HD domain-containing protein [Parvibaculum sp.]|uniref:HD domain-containing protein n=1 Tax=Parvibaculum sp. TaxID=2024848 RepID=UPI0032643165
MFKAQRIRDPLHNLITFKDDQFENALWDVIRTRPFQRLRRVKQLGFSDLVYPGASHSRFAHSIGVFHTARILMKIIEEHLGRQRYELTRAHEAMAAALVHDLGHGPFSHAFEDVGKRLNLAMANHEHVSDALIRDSEVSGALQSLGSGFPDDVAKIIKGGGTNIYSAVVSSQFDADRLDYMRRDRLMTGTQHSAIDFEWLIANLEVGEVPYGVDEKELGKLETFVLGPKSVYAAEAFVIGLFQLYPTVYFHKTTRGAEKIFSELLVRLFVLVRDGMLRNTGLSSKHPLVQFAKKPDDVESALNLDDTVVWGALSLLADAKDDVVAELSKRLRDRKLFKSVNVRERVVQRLTTKSTPPSFEAVEKVCAAIEGRIKYWCARNNKVRPRILTDKAERAPYKEFQESKGPLNQIHIRTVTDGLVDLGARSAVVAAIEPFRLYRLYAAENDNVARDFITKCINEETENAASSQSKKRVGKSGRHRQRRGG